MTARIGVAVPTLGTRPDWLSQTLRSIASQDVDSLDLLLVGPDSESLRGAAAAYGGRFAEDTAGSLSGALNIAWRNQKGQVEYWTWLGDDDLLAPASLSRVAAELDRYPEASFAYGRTRLIDGSNRSLCLTIPTRLAPRYARFGQDYIPQPGSLIRTAPLRQIDTLLDEQLRNAMDLDLFLRLASDGPRAWRYLHVEVSASRMHGDSITYNKGLEDESEVVRSRQRNIRMNTVMRRIAGPRRLMERIFYKAQWTLAGRRPHPQYYGLASKVESDE